MAVAPNPEYLQTLLETFKCFICMEKIQDAHLCPHCSKLCCYSCMHRWLTEQRSQCPHCRATLHLHEIVNCRWVEELSNQLDCLSSTSDTEGMKQIQEQRCKTHNEQLTVFCITCNSTICHRCALFDSSAHSGHSFQPVEEMYNETLIQLGRSCDNLKSKEDIIKKNIKELDKNIKEIHQAKEQKVLEIRTAVECMMLNLEKDLNNKLTTLITQKNQLVNESQHIEEFLHNCDLEVSRMPMAQLIENAPRFKRYISAIQKQPTLVLKPVYPDFHSEVIPTFEEGAFLIKSFSDKMIKGESIYSLPIGCNGVSWRLKVYPNGNGIVKERYLSVFLELTSGPPGVSRYEYRIEMMTQAKINNESKNVLREFTSDFEIGECWGYNRFFRLDLLNTEGFLHQDSLFLKFSVRPPTYYQKCREQQWYLSKLELEKSILLQQFEELKQRVPAKVKPIYKEDSSPKTKHKITLQSLFAEHLRSTDTDEKDLGASGETASNVVHSPLSIQTLCDDEFQSREIAQSMLDRLARLFEESDDSDGSSLKNFTNIDEIPVDYIDEHTNESENRLRKLNAIMLNSPKKLKVADHLQMCNEVYKENMTNDRFQLRNMKNGMLKFISESPPAVADTMTPINISASGNKTDLQNQTDHGLHNPLLFNTENPTVHESDNPSPSNGVLDLSNMSNSTDDILNTLADYSYLGDILNCLSEQRSSSDDEMSVIDESMGPDHLTKD